MEINAPFTGGALFTGVTFSAAFFFVRIKEEEEDECLHSSHLFFLRLKTINEFQTWCEMSLGLILGSKETHLQGIFLFLLILLWAHSLWQSDSLSGPVW